MPGQWDRSRLEQLLSNLVTNAIKYGLGRPIDVAVEADDARVKLSVRDRGIGISAPDQQRIFGRFERAVSDRNYAGFGLGLWIARKIVEAHKGTIRVESQENQGACFVVELPRSRTGSARS